MAVRVRDRESRVLKRFAGLDWYPVDPKWKREARLQPFSAPRTVPVPNFIGDPLDRESPGFVTFDVGGERHRLDAFTGKEGELFIVFGGLHQRSRHVRRRALSLHRAAALLHGSTTEPIWCRRRRRSRRHRGGLRRPERQHRVQHGAPHHRFALLRLEPLRPETAAEDPFVPEERTLHAGLLPVTGFFLPTPVFRSRQSSRYAGSSAPRGPSPQATASPAVEAGRRPRRPGPPAAPTAVYTLRVS